MNPFEGDTFSTEDILASMRKPWLPRIVDPSMEAVRESGLASHGLPQLAPLPAKQPAEARSNTLGGSRYPPAINPGPELDYAIGRGAGLNPFEAGPALWEGGKQAVADWGAGNKEKAISEFWGPTVLGIFAGPKSKTANLKMLKAAQEMHGKVHPDEITLKTGWSRNADGQWQYEINDNPSRLTDEARKFVNAKDENMAIGGKEAGPVKLPEVFDHEALYKAYPGARDLGATLFYSRELGGNAGIMPKDQNRMYVVSGLGGIPDARKSFLHELNHFVADIEGFDPGTSWRKFYENKPFIETLGRTNAANKGLDLDKMMPAAREEFLQKVAKRLYVLSRGEVASRNVERRADMTAKKRREFPPERTEEIDREHQVPSAQRLGKQREDGRFEVDDVIRREGDDNPFEPATEHMAAWHGSPVRDITEFKTPTFMATEGVARLYRKEGGGGDNLNGKGGWFNAPEGWYSAHDALDRPSVGQDRTKAIEHLRREIKDYDDLMRGRAENWQKQSWLQRWRGEPKQLNPDVADFLKRHAADKEAGISYLESGKPLGAVYETRIPKPTGHYNRNQREDIQKAIAEGHKVITWGGNYPDGAHELVVLDPKVIQIIRQYGMAGAIPAAGVAAMAGDDNPFESTP
jgi:hypothetical protein